LIAAERQDPSGRAKTLQVRLSLPRDPVPGKLLEPSR
jgi:hypothetical protein